MIEDNAAAAKRIVSLYEDTAVAWDAARRDLTAPERPYLDAFNDALGTDAEILDIGCGSGVPVARHLIERGLTVTGVDASPSLIALCRDRFPAARWEVADMRTLDLGRRFAGLLTWHSFFHLSPDHQRAMSRSSPVTPRRARC